MYMPDISRREECYVTLKVSIAVSSEENEAPASRELAAYDHMADITTSNVGVLHLRQLEDDFVLTSPDGFEHNCFVHQPASTNMAQLQRSFAGKVLPEDALKIILLAVLKALDFLHTDAGIVHTDLKADNILLTLVDKVVLEEFAETLRSYSPVYKVDPIDARKIYESVGFSKFLGASKSGQVVVGDFGEARIVNPGERLNPCLISPAPYRAPETILELAWDSKVDVWTVGTMVWSMSYNDVLFKDEEGSEELSESWHLAQMIALLGPPPLDLLQRNERYLQWFDEKGSSVPLLRSASSVLITTLGAWKADNGVGIPSMSLEMKADRPKIISKRLFLNFIRSMLCWRPEDRKTAKQLLEDEWLNSKNGENQEA